jgi:hypothetical protein
VTSEALGLDMHLQRNIPMKLHENAFNSHWLTAQMCRAGTHQVTCFDVLRLFFFTIGNTNPAHVNLPGTSLPSFYAPIAISEDSNIKVIPSEVAPVLCVIWQNGVISPFSGEFDPVPTIGHSRRSYHDGTEAWQTEIYKQRSRRLASSLSSKASQSRKMLKGHTETRSIDMH